MQYRVVGGASPHGGGLVPSLYIIRDKPLVVLLDLQIVGDSCREYQYWFAARRRTG